VLALDTIINGILLGGLWALLGLGKQITLGYLDFLNFAHGQTALVAMYAAVLLWDATRVDPFILLLVECPLMLVVALLLDWLLVGPLSKRPPVSQIVCTLGLFMVIESLALIIFGPQYKAINVFWSTTNVGPNQLPINAGLLLTFAISALLFLAAWFVLNRTSAGTLIRAVAGNREAAVYNGINARAVLRYGFVASVVLVGFVGGMYAVNTTIDPTSADPLLLLMFVVTIIGGFGSIGGTFLAGLLVGVLQGLSLLYLPSAYENVIVYGIFIMFLVFRPTGLRGWRDVRES
jgi:branched-chain amino acid transport system permease protein